jgi:alanyl-tRNA synthetase
MKTKEIREKFISYFVDNDHKEIKSSSLVPHNDPTLMFTNSGMVQFKNIFTGLESVDYKRATSAQKCVRAGGKHNDLENVGYTARHHTFFEMLGNFSFGDYFKESAIYYAWNLITKEFCVPRDRLYATVYHTDEEAIKYWKKIANLSDDRIIKISTNDNFWSMGDSGPCGPCSEIFYDYGDKIFGGLPGTKDQDGDRYVEIWNMVFMQFEQIDKDTRIELPKKSIDTGMGLERIASVLQGFHDNYSTDTFKEIISSIEEITNIKSSEQNANHYKVISDHLRSCVFLIADGVMPSNEGRGYVLRRIMRRAMRYVHNLGYKDLLMHKLTPTVMSLMGDVYPEIKRAESLINSILYNEEDKFKSLLSRGLKILDEEMLNLKDNTLEGKVAFKLYDTYGFPIDLTEEILRNKNIKLDEEGFDICMNEQKRLARESWVGSGESKNNQIWFDLKEKFGSTEFLGYSSTESDGKILAIIEDSAFLNSKIHDDNKEFMIISNQTPFYGESGGQLGDIGYITGASFEVKVLDTKKYLGVIAHICKTLKGKIEVGDFAKFKINSEYRQELRIHHSATHILHEVLRKKIGTHITQKGSLVAHDKLRFDVSHHSSISPEIMHEIELEVNKIIRKNIEVETKIMSLDSAISTGAMALFGEKYDTEVRVVEMDGHSVELCGGTHVSRTGDIGYFKITNESSIASGVRRIEAVCGEAAVKLGIENENIIKNISHLINSPSNESETKIKALIEENKKLEKDLFNIKIENLYLKKDEIENVDVKNGTKLIVKSYIKSEEIDPKILRSSMEHNIKNYSNLVLVTISNYDGKVFVVIGSSTEMFSAVDIMNFMSKSLGGNGGGNKKIAQCTIKKGNEGDVEKMVNKFLFDL